MRLKRWQQDHHRYVHAPTLALTPAPAQKPALTNTSSQGRSHSEARVTCRSGVHAPTLALTPAPAQEPALTNTSANATTTSAATSTSLLPFRGCSHLPEWCPCADARAALARHQRQHQCTSPFAACRNHMLPMLMCAVWMTQRPPWPAIPSWYACWVGITSGAIPNTPASRFDAGARLVQSDVEIPSVRPIGTHKCQHQRQNQRQRQH